MPIFKASGKVIYFADVPKCGGSSVEHYLRARFGALAFLDEHFLAEPGSRQWSRSSPQHIPVDMLERLFPASFFDAAFAVVRHPVERLVSEYLYLCDHLQRIDKTESFSTWVAGLQGAIADSPWCYDNHLRPMADLVPAQATVFRLETGLEPIASYLDGLFGACDRPLRFERILARHPNVAKVVPSPEDIATIERLYERDFDRFGYARQATLVHKPVTSVPARAESSPRTDRTALAAQFRNNGITCFKDGDHIQAHANFRFALNCAPQDAEIHALIANSALRLGAPHLAANHAAQALEQMPDNLDAKIAQAGARIRLKDPKAGESIEALAQYEELGDFSHIQHIALSVSEGNYETALFDLGEYLQTHLQGSFVSEAGQLLRQTFGLFRDGSEEVRFQQFVEGVGVLADRTDGMALAKPKPRQTACVDIIIPVYNGIEYLNTCLSSIRRWPSAAMGQIILVDDCSSPETSAWLVDYRDRNNDVHLIRNAENLGFTRSVMVGVRQSKAPYMLFLNSDTQVTSQWLESMLEAIHAGPNTALVGPLSNNAFYQTIQLQPKIGAAPSKNRTPDDFAALVRTMTKKVFPRVPFLSGFCLLIARDAFDSAGGLDCESFPHGYWEVQDLCLKLIDLGFDSVIADHVYVHHEGGGSIVSSRKEDLIKAGRATMYERYSALRVLIAEAVSAFEPEVSRHCQGLSQLDHIAQFLHLPNSKNLVEPRTLGPAGQFCRKEPIGSVEGREVCLFVTHCPLGAVSDYTLIYLDELKRAGLLVIACLVVEDLSIPVADDVMERADGVLLRENGGYDFGAWADLLRRFPQVWGAERLYFVNDSILGPFQSLLPLIDNIRKQNAGFFALSEVNSANSYHAQSFFFGWAQHNLQAHALKSFWDHLVNYSSKGDVINNYEFGIAKISKDLPDSSQQIVFGFENIFGCSQSEISYFNTTHDGWKRLLKVGFPFVKTDLLRDGVALVDSSDWETVCAAYGADVAAMHRSIEISRINRLGVGLISAELADG